MNKQTTNRNTRESIRTKKGIFAIILGNIAMIIIIQINLLVLQWAKDFCFKRGKYIHRAFFKGQRSANIQHQKKAFVKKGIGNGANPGTKCSGTWRKDMIHMQACASKHSRLVHCTSLACSAHGFIVKTRTYVRACTYVRVDLHIRMYSLTRTYVPEGIIPSSGCSFPFSFHPFIFSRNYYRSSC